MIIFEIKNPKSEEGTPGVFSQILANVANQSPASILNKLLLGHKDPSLFLEMFTINQSVHFFLICEDYLKSYFHSQLTAQYPRAQITPHKDYLIQLTKLPATSMGEMVLKNAYYYPINTFRIFREQDPMGSVVGILSKLTGQETAVIQYVLLPAGSSWQAGTKKLIDVGIVDAATGRRSALPNERTMNEKIMLNGLRVGIRILVNATKQQRADTVLTDLSGSFGVFARGDGNALRLKKPGYFGKTPLLKSILDRRTASVSPFQVLNIDEIASLFHPPGNLLSGIKNIAWGGQLLSEAPDNLPISDPAMKQDEKQTINFFGRTEYKNEVHTFGIRHDDRRRHIYVVGKTGTGKTTLIANMAINDMRNGEGLAVIDPHGDLCTILLDYVPKNRINDVAYLDPSDTNYPFHLNPLELPKNATGTQAELVASGIVSIFYKLYHYSWGPRMEYILRNALLTLTAVPNTTLVDVPRLLSDPSFRNKIVEKMEDPVLGSFWTNEYAKMGDKLQAEAITPILNKIGQFVTSPMIRNIIGSPVSTIDFADMMNQGKIVIANLSQGKLGEDNAALLGAMFITKMQLAAMSRVYMEEASRRDFYLYVDEFQNFATQSFLKILSEARKYRLNLTLANQYIGQIDEEVKKAIFGNVGSIVNFLVGAEDAKRLSFEFGEEFEANDFVSLGNYQMLLKMAIEGHTSRPFYATSLPLPRSKNQNKDKVIRVSRERYGRKNS